MERLPLQVAETHIEDTELFRSVEELNGMEARSSTVELFRSSHQQLDGENSGADSLLVVEGQLDEEEGDFVANAPLPHESPAPSATRSEEQGREEKTPSGTTPTSLHGRNPGMSASSPDAAAGPLVRESDADRPGTIARSIRRAVASMTASKVPGYSADEDDDAGLDAARAISKPPRVVRTIALRSAKERAFRKRQATKAAELTHGQNVWNKLNQARRRATARRKARRSARLGREKWGWLFKSLAGFGIVAAVFAVLTMALVFVLGIAASQVQDKDRLDGFPPYITEEMIVAALDAQASYGHPAGCTIAQIIVESGQGTELSGLATKDKNLFGMKYTASQSMHPEVTGYSEWATSEEYVPGTSTTITARFTSFRSYRDCIMFRSRVFLQYPNYANEPLIQEAIEELNSDKMAEGLKAAGWATSSAYVASLKSAMDEWGLRDLDGMTVEEWKESHSGGKGQEYESASVAQKRIVQSCHSTPSPGLNWCAAWVSLVYSNAGLGYLGGNACDMYYAHCTSSNKADLKVGMIVAVPSSPFGQLGLLFGHVGIYVGDGKVMHNVGGIATIDVDEWIEKYAFNCTARWGWPSGSLA